MQAPAAFLWVGGPFPCPNSLLLEPFLPTPPIYIASLNPWGHQPGAVLETVLETLHIHICSRAVTLPWWFRGKESTCQCRRLEFDSWVRKISWRNSNPLQYSCLGNPMNRGVWWATIHGVTKSQTQLSMHSQGDNIIPTKKGRWLFSPSISVKCPMSKAVLRSGVPAYPTSALENQAQGMKPCFILLIPLIFSKPEILFFKK